MLFMKEETNELIYVLDWDKLFEFKNFFNEFFSAIYTFSEKELINYYKKIELGHEFTCPSIDSEPLGVGQARYGLKYNRNVFWSESLRELYSKDSNTIDFNFYYIENFEELPLNINKQVNSHLHFEQSQHNYHKYNSNSESNPKIEKYYDDILNKKVFSDIELLNIIKNYRTDYFCNRYFINKLNYKIKKDIPDFEIIKFYAIFPSNIPF